MYDICTWNVSIGKKMNCINNSNNHLLVSITGIPIIMRELRERIEVVLRFVIIQVFHKQCDIIYVRLV